MAKKQTEKKRERSAGILMPIFSLPGPYGIGTLGKAAYEFVDFVASMGHKYWQVLPVGPTGYGDSPYQSYSAFAGNPYLIDLECLIEEGLLEKEEVEATFWGESKTQVDYGALFAGRLPLLRQAFARSTHAATPEYAAFCRKAAFWLEDYALFMAVKQHFHYKGWQEWDDKDIRLAKRGARAKYRKVLQEEVEFQCFLQFLFFSQWEQLKQYANDKGIRIIGDIPLYVSMDSADAWRHSELFDLDIDRNAVNIAGVPPDLFSADGQRWGNPLYRWDVMEADNFRWWRERMKANAAIYDVIRIDHFIGIVNYWSIPANCRTAKRGKWKKGPGEKLTRVINETVGAEAIIAEDLGVLTQPVKDLMQTNGYPGMKILEFGVAGDSSNDYLMHNYKTPNCVAYVGTHDNETLAGFLQGRQQWEIDWMKGYFGILKTEELHDQMMRKLYESIADTVIFQMQDFLKLDNTARINHPSTVGTNWTWRMEADAYKKIDIGYYHWLCGMFGRNER